MEVAKEIDSMATPGVGSGTDVPGQLNGGQKGLAD